MSDLTRRVAKQAGLTEATVKRVLETFCDEIGWDEIHAYQDEMKKGQSIYEDAGGCIIRKLRRLFGLPCLDEEVITYQRAAKALVKEALAAKPEGER